MLKGSGDLASRGRVRATTVTITCNPIKVLITLLSKSCDPPKP